MSADDVSKMNEAKRFVTTKTPKQRLLICSLRVRMKNLRSSWVEQCDIDWWVVEGVTDGRDRNAATVATMAFK